MSNQDDLDHTNNMGRGIDIDGAIDDLKSSIDPTSLIPKLLLAALVQAIIIFGIIGIITLIFGSLPWLWWTGVVLFAAASTFSVFAYFKARSAYKKLNKIENSLSSIVEKIK